MPWTRQQVKYLLSDSSPLTAKQEAKMKKELHSNPAMGHKKKEAPEKKEKPETESHAYDWRQRSGLKRGK